MEWSASITYFHRWRVQLSCHICLCKYFFATHRFGVHSISYNTSRIALSSTFIHCAGCLKIQDLNLPSFMWQSVDNDKKKQVDSWQLRLSKNGAKKNMSSLLNTISKIMKKLNLNFKIVIWNMEFAPRSFDLTPLDFFLWVYLIKGL